MSISGSWLSQKDSVDITLTEVYKLQYGNTKLSGGGYHFF